MTTNRLRTITTILLMIMAASWTQAQQVWTLRQCIDHAYNNNLRVSSADISVSQSEVALTRARHSRYPNLNASTGLNLNFGRTIDPTTNDFITQSFLSNNINLNTGVTLYNGGAINNTIRQSQALLLAATHDKDQTRKDIALQVAQAFLNILFAQENLTLTQQQLGLSQDQLAQTQKLVDAGARPANEVLDIEAQIAVNEQNIVGNENALDLAYLNLKQLLRLDPSEEIRIDAPTGVKPTLDPDRVSFEELYSRALETQSFVKAGEMRLEGAKYSEKIAKAGILPTVGLGANLGTNYNNRAQQVDGFTDFVNYQDLEIDGQTITVGFPSRVPNTKDQPYIDQLDQNLSYGVGMQVSVPIYNRYNNKANIENAKLNTQLQENQLLQQKDNLKVTIQQAHADAKAAKRRSAAAEKSYAAANRALANAQKRYDLGTINPIEYVTVKNQSDNAQINALIARYDYIFKTKVLDFYLGNDLGL